MKKDINIDIIEVNRVLKIMSNSERNVIKNRKEEIDNYNRYSNYEIHPIPQYISSNHRINVRKDSIKVTEYYSRMSNWYDRQITIPLEYFDMTDEKIYSTHEIWTECAIDDIFCKKEKKKVLTINHIESQIEDLQKQLLTLTK